MAGWIPQPAKVGKHPHNQGSTMRKVITPLGPCDFTTQLHQVTKEPNAVEGQAPTQGSFDIVQIKSVFCKHGDILHMSVIRVNGLFAICCTSGKSTRQSWSLMFLAVATSNTHHGRYRTPAECSSTNDSVSFATQSCSLVRSLRSSLSIKTLRLTPAVLLRRIFRRRAMAPAPCL